MGAHQQPSSCAVYEFALQQEWWVRTIERLPCVLYALAATAFAHLKTKNDIACERNGYWVASQEKGKKTKALRSQ